MGTIGAQEGVWRAVDRSNVSFVLLISFAMPVLLPKDDPVTVHFEVCLLSEDKMVLILLLNDKVLSFTSSDSIDSRPSSVLLN